MSAILDTTPQDLPALIEWLKAAIEKLLGNYRYEFNDVNDDGYLLDLEEFGRLVDLAGQHGARLGSGRLVVPRQLMTPKEALEEIGVLLDWARNKSKPAKPETPAKSKPRKTESTPPELAQRTGYAHETILRWINSGELDAYNSADPGQRPRYHIPDQAWEDFKRRRLHPAAVKRLSKRN
jgi:hypothetical protein